MNVSFLKYLICYIIRELFSDSEKITKENCLELLFHAHSLGVDEVAQVQYYLFEKKYNLVQNVFNISTSIFCVIDSYSTFIWQKFLFI